MAGKSRALALLFCILAAILTADLSAADEGVPKDAFGMRLKPRVRVSVRRLSPTEEAEARSQPVQQQPTVTNNKRPTARGQLIDDTPQTSSNKQLDNFDESRTEFMKRQLRINQEMRLKQRQSRDKKPSEDGHSSHEHHEHHGHVEDQPQISPEDQEQQQLLRSQLTIGDFEPPTPDDGAQSYYDLPEDPVPFNVEELPSARAEDEAASSDALERQAPSDAQSQEPNYKYGPPKEQPKEHGHGYGDASQQQTQGANAHGDQTTMMPMDASYNFGYNFDEVSRNEAADPGGNVVGNFTYLDDTGRPLTVEYKAGKDTGFVIVRDDRVPASAAGSTTGQQQQPNNNGAQQQVPTKQTQVYNQPKIQQQSQGPAASGQHQPSSSNNGGPQIQLKQPQPSHSYGPPAQQKPASGYGQQGNAGAASQHHPSGVGHTHQQGQEATTMMPMDASYNFGYNLPEGSRNEAADPNGNVQGNFTYLDENGRPVTVEYKAGKGTGVVILRDDRVPQASGQQASTQQHQGGGYAKPGPQQTHHAAPQKQQRPGPVPRPQPQQRPNQPVRAVVVPIKPVISSPLPPQHPPKPKPYPQQQQHNKQQPQQQPPAPISRPQQQYGPPKPAVTQQVQQQQYRPPRPAPQQPPIKPQHQQYQPAPSIKPQQQYQQPPAKPQQHYGPPKPAAQVQPRPQQPQPIKKPAAWPCPQPPAAASSPSKNQYQPNASPVKGNNMMMPMPYKFAYTGPHGVYRMEQADASGNFVSKYGYNLGPGHTNLMWERTMGNANAFPAFQRIDGLSDQSSIPLQQQDFTSFAQQGQNPSFDNDFRTFDLRQGLGEEQTQDGPAVSGQDIPNSVGDNGVDQRTFFPLHPSWPPANNGVQQPTEEQPLPALPSHHERAQAFSWNTNASPSASASASAHPASPSTDASDIQFTMRHGQQQDDELMGPPTAYRFSYDAGDHRRSESLDPNRVVSGSYSFVGDDGIERTVQYSAGPGTGFVAQGDHLPQPPAVPQQQQQTLHQHKRRSARHSPFVSPPWSAYYIPGGYSYSISY